MKNFTYIIGIFLFGFVVGGFAVYIVPASGTMPQGGTKEISVLKEIPKGAPAPADVLYTSEQYGFSFRYPQGLVYKEFDNGDGSQTIVFQHPTEEQKGFQIYITPYSGETITGDRILYDASGKVSDLKEEYLREDFLTATFKSETPFLGATSEIWWLHDGHLFETTTYAASDAWFRDIIKTTEFQL